MSGKPTTRRQKLIFAVIMIVMTLAAIEVIVRIAAGAGLCHIRTFQTVSHADDIKFVGDINPTFGVWHPPNASVAVKTPQGDVTYETNKHGMRDKSREEKSDAAERVVVLGDSFTEGQYVEEEKRATDVLEKRTGIEFLNFGTSGDFGSVQEWLLYEHLASKFDHSRVFVFFLPDNDFADNNPALHSASRYRPYLVITNGAHEITYPVAFEDAERNLFRISPSRKFRRHIYNNWYSLNLIVYRDFKQIKDAFRAHTHISSYDNFTPEDLEKTLYSYERILELSAPRPVTVFIIPRDEDFLTYESGRMKGSIVSALNDFAEQHDRLEIVDLMPAYLAYMKENNTTCKPFFLSYDPHWSSLGHRIAADVAQAHLQW